MTGSFLVKSRPAHILFDSDASYSFVSNEFEHSFQIACYTFAQSFHVDTVGSVLLLADKVYREIRISILG